MRKKNLIKVGLLLLIMFLAIAFAGFLIWNKPHIKVQEVQAIQTDANSLYHTLSSEDSISNSHFVNKVIAVSGQVKQVQKNEEGSIVVLLKTNVEGASVNCTMEEKNVQLEAGDAVKIKGICLGYMNGDPQIDLPGDVFLSRCYVLNKK